MMRVLHGYYDEATKLIVKYGRKRRLRSLDALHLGIFAGLLGRREAEAFVTADAVLDEIARTEGWSVINPLAS